MKFPTSFLDELRMRLPASQVVKKKVQLRHNGREHSGLCPFHKEKTPSFTVNDDKGFYHCFGCGAHGDIVKFVMETEGLRFAEAIQVLAPQAGLEVPKLTVQEAEREKRSTGLVEVMQMACDWFEEQLRTAQGNQAREYLKKRGISDAVIGLFKLGYAPDQRYALIRHLESKGVSKQAMVSLGLARQRDNGAPYDYFRGRIMFPIIDTRGRVVAFGGRILGDGQPKYLNSPETPLFRKGDILYNENNARTLAFKSGKLVVVEGYMDVIALHGAGIKTAVAPLGTAVTEMQIKRLWRMAPEPVVCLDGDAAGQRAMERTAHLCLPQLQPGHTLKFTVLTEGMDPDDFIRSAGVEKMRKALQNAKPLSEVLWDTELSRKDISTPERLADLEKRINALADTIASPSVRGYYQKFFRDKLWQASNRRGYRGKKDTVTRLTDIDTVADVDLASVGGCETALVVAVLNCPKLLETPHIHEEFVHIEFSSNRLDNIRTAILEVLSIKDTVGEEDLRVYLENAGLSPDISYLDRLALPFFSDGAKDERDVIKGWEYISKQYSLAHLKAECEVFELQVDEAAHAKVVEFRRQIEHLEQDIKQAEVAFGDEK